MKERRKKGRMGKASTGSLLLLLRGWEKGRKRGRVKEEEVERRAPPHPSSCWFYTRGLRGVGGGRLWFPEGDGHHEDAGCVHGGI